MAAKPQTHARIRRPPVHDFIVGKDYRRFAAAFSAKKADSGSGPGGGRVLRRNAADEQI
jgi:hypothetical protein